MSDSRADVTISLLRIALMQRRGLVDALRDKGPAFRAIADAFEEDMAVMVQARDMLVELQEKEPNRG